MDGGIKTMSDIKELDMKERFHDSLRAIGIAWAVIGGFTLLLLIFKP